MDEEAAKREVGKAAAQKVEAERVAEAGKRHQEAARQRLAQDVEHRVCMQAAVAAQIRAQVQPTLWVLNPDGAEGIFVALRFQTISKRWGFLHVSGRVVCALLHSIREHRQQ